MSLGIPVPVPAPVPPLGATEENEAVLPSRAVPQLQQLIEALCPADVRGLDVSVLSEGRVEVLVLVASEEAGQRIGHYLAQRLSQLPELAGRELALKVRVTN